MNDETKSSRQEPVETGEFQRPLAETMEAGVPVVLRDTQQLGEKLAEFEIVGREEFRTLSDTVGHDSIKILKELADNGKITNYQREQIVAGSIESIVFDDYVVLERIGVGGMGEVLKARNRHLGRTEAIKTIRGGGEIGSTALERFRREAHVLAKLEHPSIVPIYKVGTFEGVQYIAMKYVDGEDLREKTERSVKEKSPIPVRQICEWMIQTASALGHAHRSNIVHRDIKPGNVMVTHEGHVYVLDMGIARLTDPSESPGGQLTRQNIAVGTPEFMPPEQWADSTGVTPETDIYALGCTMFYVLTGRPPYVERSMVDLMSAHTSGPIPSVSQYRSEVPAGLDSVVQKMLAKRPEERYRTAEELIAALEPYCSPIAETRAPIATTAELAMDPRADQGLAGTGSRKWVWGSLLGLLLAGAIGAGVFAITRRPASDPSIETATGAPSAEESPADEGDRAVEPAIEVASAPVEPPPAIPKWVGEYQRSHTDEWESEASLVAWIEEKSGTSEVPEKLPVELREQLEAESQARAESNRRRALEAVADLYRAEHEGVWPDREELLEAMAKRTGSAGPIAADLASFRLALDEESKLLRRPFEGLRVASLKKAWERDWVQSAVGFWKEMAELQVVPKDTNWKFEAAFVDANSRTIGAAHVGEEVSLAYRSDRPVYLTIVQWDNEDLSVIARRDVKPAVQSFDSLADVSIGSAGKKSITIFATDRPYFKERVEQIEGYEVDFHEIFASPRIFDRIEESLLSGKPVAGVSGPEEAVRWTRSTASLVVRP